MFGEMWRDGASIALRSPRSRFRANVTSECSPEHYVRFKLSYDMGCYRQLTLNFRIARDSARTGRTQRPRTVVERICDLSQIDVLMQETHGNQTLPKITGTGDVA